MCSHAVLLYLDKSESAGLEAVKDKTEEKFHLRSSTEECPFKESPCNRIPLCLVREVDVFDVAVRLVFEFFVLETNVRIFRK